MADGEFPYYVLLPLIVFGPLVAWVLYTLGIGELFRTRNDGDANRQKLEEAERRNRSRLYAKGGGAEGVTEQKGRKSVFALLGQSVAYSAFIIFVGALSVWPRYQPIAPGLALMKLSLSHPGQRKVACHKRSRKELAKLAANMRAALSCPRERWPVRIDLRLDGTPIYLGSAEPAGLSNDGASAFYQTFPIPTGRHQLTVRMSDDGDPQKYTYTHDQVINLTAAQIVVVGFNAKTGLFVK
jgi:hypothetical protein